LNGWRNGFSKTKNLLSRYFVMSENLKNPSKHLGNELQYLQSVLEAESWSATSGNWNQTFEKTFAEKNGCRYAIAMNSGTATLHCALEAAGVGPGD
jgi:dTDP-4-amino-4,6-dideoxygalactose transaminase